LGHRGDRRYFAAAIVTYVAFTINGAASQSIPGWPLPAASYAGPFQVIYLMSISAAVAFVILLLLLRVVGADRREKQRLAGELEAARGVQQLLLPRHAAGTNAFAADAVYEPAQEVGGDFHWTRVTPGGALLVVVGDVSGKGLKAAMLVSVAIGILRNEKSGSPAAILGALNDGLAGHTGGGFATCCCACFDTDGRVAIANAGHLSPYCDAREVAVEPGLPLGVMAGMEYGESIVRGERFTFVSDGVVEAENAQRELFGFERTREISAKSAQEIAEAAKAWGQNDDITVVTVRRPESTQGSGK
jgi:serine phosphatase RsbU (regulator of sigma subunit)